MVMRALQKLLEPLRRRIRLMVTRGVVLLVDDGKGLQRVQVRLLAGEVLEMERFQQAGVSSVPEIGAEAIALCVGGTRSGIVALSVDDRRERPKDDPPGSATLYASGLAARVVCLPEGKVRIEAKSGVEIAGEGGSGAESVTAADFVLVDTRSLLGMIEAFNAHTHPQSGGGTTSPPGSTYEAP